MSFYFAVRSRTSTGGNRAASEAHIWSQPPACRTGKARCLGALAVLVGPRVPLGNELQGHPRWDAPPEIRAPLHD